MSVLNLFRKSFSTPTPVKSRPRVALGLEALEDRTVLSTTSIQANGVLTITGDKLDNKVTIVQNDTLNTFKVYEDVGGVNMLRGSYVSKEVDQISIDLGDGNDLLSYNLDSGTGNAFNKSATINLGNGNDMCNLGFFTKNGPQVGPLRGNLDFRVYGGSGNDQLGGGFIGKVGGRLNLILDGGAGDDRAETGVYITTVGAAVSFDLRGGAGNDLISTFSIGVGSGCAVTILMDGGDDRDYVSAWNEGELDGNLSLHMNGGGDSDSMTARVSVAAGSTGSFTGSVYGGDGDDNLDYNLNDGSGGTAQAFGLLDGGNGIDTAMTSGNVFAVNVP